MFTSSPQTKTAPNNSLNVFFFFPVVPFFAHFIRSCSNTPCHVDATVRHKKRGRLSFTIPCRCSANATGSCVAARTTLPTHWSNHTLLVAMVVPSLCPSGPRSHCLVNSGNVELTYRLVMGIAPMANAFIKATQPVSGKLVGYK